MKYKKVNDNFYTCGSHGFHQVEGRIIHITNECHAHFFITSGKKSQWYAVCEITTGITMGFHTTIAKAKTEAEKVFTDKSRLKQMQKIEDRRIKQGLSPRYEEVK